MSFQNVSVAQLREISRQIKNGGRRPVTFMEFARRINLAPHRLKYLIGSLKLRDKLGLKSYKSWHHKLSGGQDRHAHLRPHSQIALPWLNERLKSGSTVPLFILDWS